MKINNDIFSTKDVTEGDVYLNHAALSQKRDHKPLDEIRNLTLSNLYSVTKKVARAVTNIPDTHELIFTRNTTEAFGMYIHYLQSKYKKNLGVAIPFSGYESISRAGEQYFNYGEKNGSTTYSNLTRDYDVNIKPTGNTIIKFHQDEEKSIEDIIKTKKPDVIVLNKTERTNGRVEDIESKISLINELGHFYQSYTPYIISDSAQSLATSDHFFDDKVNYTVGCFHKGLGSYEPLGFGIIDVKTFDSIKDLFIGPHSMRDFFPSKNTLLSVPNVRYGKGEIHRSSYVCFLETLQFLHEIGMASSIDFDKLAHDPDYVIEEDFSFDGLINHRKKLYYLLYEKLSHIRSIEITSSFSSVSSGYIFSFKVSPDCSITAAGIVRVMSQKGIHVSFLKENMEVRVSFGPDNTEEDVNIFCSELNQLLQMWK